MVLLILQDTLNGQAMSSTKEPLEEELATTKALAILHPTTLRQHTGIATTLLEPNLLEQPSLPPNRLSRHTATHNNSSSTLPAIQGKTNHILSRFTYIHTTATVVVELVGLRYNSKATIVASLHGSDDRNSLDQTCLNVVNSVIFMFYQKKVFHTSHAKKAST